jgi:hypothetical protein
MMCAPWGEFLILPSSLPSLFGAFQASTAAQCPNRYRGLQVIQIDVPDHGKVRRCHFVAGFQGDQHKNGE